MAEIVPGRAAQPCENETARFPFDGFRKDAFGHLDGLADHRYMRVALSAGHCQSGPNQLVSQQCGQTGEASGSG